MLLMLLTSGPASAEWLQDGGDAGRTGWLAEGGPEAADVALVVAAPEGEYWSRLFPPLAYRREIVAASVRSIFRIGLDDGSLTRVADRPEPVAIMPGSPWTIRGDELYVATGPSLSCDQVALAQCAREEARILVLPLNGGTPREIELAPAGAAVDCEIAARDDALFTACFIDDSTTFGQASSLLELRRLTFEGIELWRWQKELDPRASIAPLLQPGARVTATRDIVGLTVAGGIVTVVTQTFSGPDVGSWWDGWIVDAESGTFVATADPFPEDGHYGSADDDCLLPAGPLRDVPSASVGREDVWVRKERGGCDAPNQAPTPVRLVIAPTDSSRQREVVSVPMRGDDAGTRSAISPERIYAATATHLVAVTSDGLTAWDVDLSTGTHMRPLPLLVDADRLYTFVSSDANGPVRLVAWDSARGVPLWEHAFGGKVGGAGSGPGVIVADVIAPDGTSSLVVLGRTAASLAVEPSVSNLYPGAGEFVRVDLSNVQAGLAGPATRYRAEWGDGEATEWQPSPVLEHGYNAVGDHVAYVYAGNDAGQVASATIVFQVGRPAPQNFLQQQFSADNQERTFFLLGLLITGIFAALGLLRVRRRRDLLSAELAALESAVAAARSDPVQLDRALDERRFRARSLLLDHRLDEGQHAVLAARIEELSRAARLDVAERDLGFLPHRHVLALREMLRDGRVSSLERAHFLHLLDADDTLVPEYKARVRRVVDEWARNDGAGERI